MSHIFIWWIEKENNIARRSCWFCATDKFFCIREATDYWSQIVNTRARRKFISGLGALNFVHRVSFLVPFLRGFADAGGNSTTSQWRPTPKAIQGRSLTVRAHFVYVWGKMGSASDGRIYTYASAARPLSPTLYILTAYVVCRYRLTFQLPTQISTFNCCPWLTHNLRDYGTR